MVEDIFLGQVANMEAAIIDNFRPVRIMDNSLKPYVDEKTRGINDFRSYIFCVGDNEQEIAQKACI